VKVEATKNKYRISILNFVIDNHLSNFFKKFISSFIFAWLGGLWIGWN